MTGPRARLIDILSQMIHQGHEGDHLSPELAETCARNRAEQVLTYLRNEEIIRDGHFTPLTAYSDHGRTMGLRDMADRVRADIMYDHSRGVRAWDDYLWMCLGWDVAHLGDHLRHPSEAVAQIFHVPAWRPTEEELAWFRAGFSGRRAGGRRPQIRG